MDGGKGVARLGGIPYRKERADAEGGSATKGGLRAFLQAKGAKVAGVLMLLVLAGGYAAWQGFADVRDGAGWVVGAEPDATDAASQGTGPTATGAAAAPSPTVETIRVQIMGAVAAPGIYGIPKGACLDDLVRLAGGLTETADVERINLVWRIDRSLMIRIGEKADGTTPGATRGATGTTGAGAAVVVTDQASLPEDGGGEGESAGPLDLNAATAAQLDALPGVGPSTAAAIVAYREKNGPFQKAEELMKVSGIKQSRYDAIKDLVRVG